MQEVFVLSYLDIGKRKRATFEVGDVVNIPFSGVFMGDSVKSISVKSKVDFTVDRSSDICLFKILVRDNSKGVLIGKLCSIEFL